MPEVITTIDGEEVPLPEVRELNIICHKETMNIKVPDHFEINPENTLEEIKNLNQNAWTHISTGEIFQHLFRLVYPLPDPSNHSAPKSEIAIPERIEDLQAMELGIRHVCGLIILAITRGGIEGRELFFKLPESYLHPAYQCNLADMFIVLPKILAFLSDTVEAPNRPPTAMENWLG
jgi:hypothetical protein